MKNIKALILGLLLLVPILILAFVSLFGEHHFTLKTYFPQLDAEGQVQYTANGDTVFQQVPGFSLVSQTGEAFSGSDLKEAIYVVNFFSTSCPGAACRKVSSQLVRVQEAFESNPEVKIISITVNPEQDSVEALRAYAAKYSAKEGKWFFLTGERQEIYQLAREGYHIANEAGEGQQQAIPNNKLMLVDKDRKVRGMYEGADPGEIDRLITEINVLRDEYSKRN